MGEQMSEGMKGLKTNGILLAWDLIYYEIILSLSLKYIIFSIKNRINTHYKFWWTYNIERKK